MKPRRAQGTALLRVGERVVARSSQESGDQRSEIRDQRSKRACPRASTNSGPRPTRKRRARCRPPAPPSIRPSTSGDLRRPPAPMPGPAAEADHAGPVPSRSCRPLERPPSTTRFRPRRPGPRAPPEALRSLTSDIRHPTFAGWSSPVARQAHNLKVVGSNPTPATKQKAR